METDNKVYLFVSHAHHDIEKVRVIRNFLEDLGAEPILFFLKSKTDENEITQLIKDEIDARYWFIYCRSSNSETSKWCQMELAHMEKTKKRTQFTINLDTSFTEDDDLTEDTKEFIICNLRDIIKVNSFFVSYSQNDAAYVGEIIDRLNKKGISVWYANKNMFHNDDFGASIESAISNCKFFLIFVSENSANSKWVASEYNYACNLEKTVIPVILTNGGEYDMNRIREVFPNIDTMQYFLIDRRRLHESTDKLVYDLYDLATKQQ